MTDKERGEKMAEFTQSEEEKQRQEAEGNRAKLALTPAGQDEDRDYENTMETLRQGEYSIPEFTSSYDEQISELYNKIVSREPFRYDPMSDSLYGQYRERYTQMGRLAMRDTMGQAAALTGGYGSSYAQRVGQQEYDAYLQKLGEVLPELYSSAYERYRDQGAALEADYERLTALEEAEYGRYRDQVADLKYQQGMEAEREATAYKQREEYYKKLVELINKTGYSPTAEDLEKSGMTQAQADAYLARYAGANASSSYGGTYYYGGRKGSGSASGTDKAQKKINANSGSAAGKLFSAASKGKII